MELPLLGVAAVLLLVLANGFFVATEFAIVAVRRSRAGADLVQHRDAYIAACQLGITMASLALGWIGEPALARLIEPVLAAVVGGAAPVAAHAIATGGAFALITLLHVVLGEQVPKMLALRHPEGTTRWVAPPMRAFYVAFRWPTTALKVATDAVLRLARIQPEADQHPAVTVDEVRALVDELERGGEVEPTEARIAHRAFSFADQTAAALMTPWHRVPSVPVTADLRQLAAAARARPWRRLLVHTEGDEELVGAVDPRALVAALDAPPAGLDLRRLAAPALRVAPRTPADDLLERMRRSGRPVAVVVDDAGRALGAVALEDLLCVLVGVDEESHTHGPPTPPSRDVRR